MLDGKALDPSVHLARGDVVINSGVCPAGISVNNKSSKTDLLRQGVTIYLEQTVVDLCPVAAMIDYLATRGIASGPLFQFQNGSPLQRRQLVLAIHNVWQIRILMCLSTVGIVFVLEQLRLQTVMGLRTA